MTRGAILSRSDTAEYRAGPVPLNYGDLPTAQGRETNVIHVPVYISKAIINILRVFSVKRLKSKEQRTCRNNSSSSGTSNLLSSAILRMFSAISGSDAAGAAAVGRMTIDRLVESGYPRPYACALVASGACTGILIPPSIAYIIIGLVLGISASTLFLAALIPGLLVLLSILITNIIMNRIHAYENGGAISVGEWLSNIVSALKSGWYAFLVPGIIFYGIFSGRLTPTEAGATAVIVTIILGFILGTLKLSDFPSMLVSSAKVNGVILPIIALSLPLAQALAAMGVPQGFVYAVTSLTENPYLLTLLMIGILIAAGCVMETTPNIVILAPLLKPVADAIGMNEIQFCIMMITSLGIGFITPPLGLNLFVVSGITGESTLKIAAKAWPFMFFMLFIVLLIAFIPELSTILLPDSLK